MLSVPVPVTLCLSPPAPPSSACPKIHSIPPRTQLHFPYLILLTCEYNNAQKPVKMEANTNNKGLVEYLVAISSHGEES